MTFLLDLKLVTLNDMKGRHWSRRHTLKREVGWALLDAGARLQLTPPPRARQHVTLTRILGPRERAWDDENLAGGSAKAIFDVLTELGYWRDDSPKWIDRTYRQDATRRKEGPAVEVRIEPAE